MNFNNSIAPLVIKDLVSLGIVPEYGNFDLEESQLDSYIRLYDTYVDKDFTSLKKEKSRISYGLARKLAALTLIKLKISRGVKGNQCREGFIYTLTNPAWANHVKIGISIDVKKRLQTYQTYSPYRDYKISSYDFVFDKRSTEKCLLKNFGLSIEAGEWIKNSDAADIMKFIRNSNNIPNEPSW